jgi:hypothetical protein
VLGQASTDHCSDNVATVSNLNRFGGPNPALTALVHRAHTLLLQHAASIHSRFIPDSTNKQADTLSRLSDRHEWKLHRRLFRLLDLKWGPHTIDRFASDLSHQLPRYNARHLDPLCEPRMRWHRTGPARTTGWIRRSG